jgi:hypothetical protein
MMSRRSVPRPPSAPRLTLADIDVVLPAAGAAPGERISGHALAALLDVVRDRERLLEPEAIALRIHQIAAVAGVLAEGQDAPLSHALHLISESLLDVGERVDRLRARAGSLATAFHVERTGGAA